MSEEAASGQAHILVVDDSPVTLEMVQWHLVSAGYTVTLAETGEQALKLFSERAPDFVLLDILMPGIDGLETCRRLRALPESADTPIVFLTSVADLEVHKKALNVGADDFLTKPISNVELILRVRSLLRIKRLTQETTSAMELVRSQRDALLHAKKLREELSALIVHDLKNPLTTILANLHFLSEEGERGEAARSALADAERSAENMYGMVLNLLDVARGEDGSLVAQIEVADLREIIEQARSAMATRALEKRQQLSSALPSGPLTVRADRELLRRVIENLLDNSLKYTPQDGAIRIEAGRADGHVQIRVQDQGPGVPLEWREKIFDKYVRLERDAAQARNSRGLGLLFCRMAVEAHGGRIWVEDSPPQGSVFCVELPG